MPIEYWNPTPIYYKDHEIVPEDVLKEILSNEEKIEFLYDEDVWQDNVHSTFYKCSNIVQELKMINLYQFLSLHLTDYFKEMNFIPSETRLYNSWFNKIYKHGFQDFHTHSVNCIAGCFYYDLNLQQENGIQFSFSNHNFSHKSVTYEYKPGRLILFPGHISHRVPYKKTDGIRKSFSFNFLVF